MEYLYRLLNFNESIFYQFLSAIFSIVLTVTIIYIKREIERNNRENYYNGIATKDHIFGDIKIKIDEELPRENYLQLITMWAIQPLLLLVLISFIDNQNTYIKICLFFSLIIFTLLHEFLTGLKYSDNKKYQVTMLFVWLISFSILSYEKNNIEKEPTKSKTAYSVRIHQNFT
ncbi:hypothetical protein ACHRV1_25045 [Flavobacterium aquidurense]|uniref:Uncharacterized protein n=2 Tax=Flavobacterium TaxID=237 RepID=A0A7W7IW48_9FLAO|nr:MULTISPECIES: hypothetical protein [Flavobacterium]MBB4801668.1 hypothetical protein [Flavobacterium nitrogenifigens]MBB6386626.1 hypothetical protein [Flavobacterium notoginsengisoli]